jgi:hypothetical protein
MNAYTTTGQARIQPRDFAAVLRANRLAGASLAAFERQRGCQAEVEVEWLLKHNGVMPQRSASRVALLRQTIGAALIRAAGSVPGHGHLATTCASETTVQMSSDVPPVGADY